MPFMIMWMVQFVPGELLSTVWMDAVRGLVQEEKKMWTSMVSSGGFNNEYRKRRI